MKDIEFKEVDLTAQQILLDLGILKSSDGLTYDTYVPQVHVANLVEAMKRYAHSHNVSDVDAMVDALEKCIRFKNGQYEGVYLNRLFDECEKALKCYKTAHVSAHERGC